MKRSWNMKWTIGVYGFFLKRYFPQKIRITWKSNAWRLGARDKSSSGLCEPSIFKRGTNISGFWAIILPPFGVQVGLKGQKRAVSPAVKASLLL